jgi:hypothetical protein
MAGRDAWDESNDASMTPAPSLASTSHHFRNHNTSQAALRATYGGMYGRNKGSSDGITAVQSYQQRQQAMAAVAAAQAIAKASMNHFYDPSSSSISTLSSYSAGSYPGAYNGYNHHHQGHHQYNQHNQGGFGMNTARSVALPGGLLPNASMFNSALNEHGLKAPPPYRK